MYIGADTMQIILISSPNYIHVFVGSCSIDFSPPHSDRIIANIFNHELYCHP